MCILSFIPAGVMPNMQHLRNGGRSNPDGHGWAIVTRDAAGAPAILVGKSLDLETALSEFEQARDEHPGGPALFHSRYATHGSITVDNVHPFPVGHSPLTVMGHNGILPSSVHPGKGDDRSDTRLFSDEVLCTTYRRLDKPRAFDALTNFIGSGNKLVILTVDPKYASNFYIVNERAGTWDTDTGVWHSNTAYRESYSCYRSSVSRSAWLACEHCAAGMIDDDGYCDRCFVCADCDQRELDCECYMPAGRDDRDDDERYNEWLDNAADEDRHRPRRDYLPWWEDMSDDIAGAAARAELEDRRTHALDLLDRLYND